MIDLNDRDFARNLFNSLAPILRDKPSSKERFMQKADSFLVSLIPELENRGYITDTKDSPFSVDWERLEALAKKAGESALGRL